MRTNIILNDLNFKIFRLFVPLKKYKETMTRYDKGVVNLLQDYHFRLFLKDATKPFIFLDLKRKGSQL